ncbi:MAG: PDZ domain-containing protein [Proteobacteria bacterium]|nr:MAG: PDZ domain-containing protein [Pseudomonadota bacterium]
MQHWKRATFKTVLYAFVAFVLLGATQVWVVPRFDSKVELSAIGAVKDLAQRPRAERKKTEPKANAGLSDSLLIDSIMTIVQNYYVDEDRVGNRKLMEETLKALEVQDFIRLSFPSPDTWAITKAGETISIKLAETYTFDEMVRDSLKVARFLDRHPAAGSEKKKNSKNGAHMIVDAMLAGLDPHSNLLDSEEYRDLRQGTEGSFGGLGVVVGMQDDVLTVVKPLPKSPASRAGVAKLDRIMQIDEKNTFGTTLDDLIQYMRGEPGTKVRLSLLRDGDLAPRSVQLTREIIQVDSVEAKIIPSPKGNVFYAFIDSFSSRTAAELREALIKAQQSKSPIIGVVLDMRSNPGGLLDQAVKVADLFLDEGKILTTQGRSREFDMAKKNLYHFDYPIAILTNGDTASASEIVAGALKDQGRAVVIGEPSFGKGSVQTVFELPGEQALKLTIARYFTPKGISIQNIGISPDIWLQPISKNKTNLNLLGDYRYKSERFLDHSLDQEKAKTVMSASRSQKAYYLVPSEKKDTDPDVPLLFATKFLGELAKRDGVPFPPERLRSSYWKASADAFVKKSLLDFDKSTTEWLARDQKVNWAEAGESADDDKNLQFTVQMPKRLSMQEGKTLEVPYQLKNVSKKPIYRLSVYLSSIQSSLGTNEMLIGKIEAGQTLNGTMKFDMKVSAKEGSVRMRAGLARSGWPVPNREKEFYVELTETKKPDISMSMALVSEEGGSQVGILEPSESAKIRVTLRNNSNVLAHKVELKLVSLAGKQIAVDTKGVVLGDMKPGEVKVALVPVKSGTSIVTNEFKFGALVETEEFVIPTKMHFALPSSPKARMSKSDVLTGTGPWKEN